MPVRNETKLSSALAQVVTNFVTLTAIIVTLTLVDTTDFPGRFIRLILFLQFFLCALLYKRIAYSF